jgi:hypothetical protein
MYFDCEYLICIFLLLMISSDNFELTNQLNVTVCTWRVQNTNRQKCTQHSAATHNNLVGYWKMRDYVAIIS